MFLVIEKYSKNARFCIICNYISKIIPALQSRCTRFRFAPLTADQARPRLEAVVKQEKYAMMAPLCLCLFVFLVMFLLFDARI